MGDAERPELRRPNGRLQACDPCRSRKVACDHAQPVCARCSKNRINDQCVYTSTAPRTRYTTRRTRRSTTTPCATPAFRPNATSTTHSNDSFDESQTVHAPPLSERITSSGFIPSPGFLGYMSHNEVFEETKRSLSLLHGANSERADAMKGRGHSRPPISFRSLPSPLREMCLFVLRRLPGQSEQQMTSHHMEPRAWADVAVAKIIRSLENDFGLRGKRSDSDLEQIAEVICINTTKPLRDIDSSSEWMDQFTGLNVRWEAIGIIWAYLEGISTAIDTLHKRSLEWLPGKRSPETSLLCLSYCIDIACRFSQGNIILVDLSRRKAALQSMISGDAGFDCWTTLGQVVSMSTFMGLHTLENPPDYHPSLCSEYKRTVFSQIFLSDIGAVSFTGRPPLISSRHCSTPMPLDLRDRDLIANDIVPTEALELLDENGWSTAGGISATTHMRAQSFLGRILDDVCEITLTNNGRTTLDYIRLLQERQRQTVANFPQAIQYNAAEWDVPDPDMPTIYAKLIIHLVDRRIAFLLERLLLRNGASDEGDLLVTSFDMVSSTVVLWTHKDKFSPMRRNFDWLVMAFGAPAGGILCQELLKPTFRGVHPKNPELSRSSIIQRLSLLIGFLDWIQPPAPNADLCNDCKQIIQRVLDHHLNAETDRGHTNSFDWNFDNSLDFNFDLLDTYDWFRTDHVQEE